jgi:transcriptional regulator with XRE-family HTH domain
MATKPITADDVTTGRNLYLLRRAAKLDQRQLSEALAGQGFIIAASTLSRTETGKRAVSAAEVTALAAFFDVKPRDLTGGATREESPNYPRFDQRPTPRLELAPALIEVGLPSANNPPDLLTLTATLVTLTERLMEATRAILGLVELLQEQAEKEGAGERREFGIPA